MRIAFDLSGIERARGLPADPNRLDRLTRYRGIARQLERFLLGDEITGLSTRRNGGPTQRQHGQYDDDVSDHSILPAECACSYAHSCTATLSIRQAPWKGQAPWGSCRCPLPLSGRGSRRLEEVCDGVVVR